MLFVKLLLAHLIGDFFLQPRKWLLQKQAKKARSWFLYVHVLIHFALVMLLLWDVSMWKIAGIIALSHLGIDLVKLYTQHRFKNGAVPFVLDQAAHVLVLFIVATYPYSGAEVAGWFSEANWPLLTGLCFVTYPSAFLIAKLLEKPASRIPTDHKSLPQAGTYIGILERLFVFLFILLDRWEAIGLLIAAKSVFRFNDLRESHNRKWTEYILIGTLLSFALAILAGLAVR